MPVRWGGEVFSCVLAITLLRLLLSPLPPPHSHKHNDVIPSGFPERSAENLSQVLLAQKVTFGANLLSRSKLSLFCLYNDTTKSLYGCVLGLNDRVLILALALHILPALPVVLGF